MVDSFEVLIDGQDLGFPKGEFGLKIQVLDNTNAVFVSMDNDVTLVGAAYNYIYGIAKLGYCNRISVQVIYACTGANSRVIATGYILVSECEFDIDKCQLKTKIFDDAFQTKVNNNKSIEMYSQVSETKNLVPMSGLYSELPNGQKAQLFRPNPGNSTTYTGQYAYGWSVYNTFRLLVEFISDGEIEFRSTFFDTGFGNAFMVTSGASIRSGRRLQFKTSFESMYEAMNRKFKLGFGFEKINGKTILRMEPASFFKNNPPAFSLLDVPGIKAKYDKENIFANIELGSDEFLEEWESSKDGIALSFPQVRFFGFKKESFGLTGICNTDSTLELSTSKVIIDTNIIEDILMHGNQNYEERPVIIELPYYAGSAKDWDTKNAGFEDIFGTGTLQYNPSLTNDHQAERNIASVPGSIWNYYQGYNAALTEFKAKGVFADQTVPFTAMVNPSYYSDPDKVDRYLLFASVITDAGGNYTPSISGNPSPNNGSFYKVPAPGMYTFKARIRRKADTDPVDGNTGFNQRIVFVRLTSTYELITKVYSPPSGQVAKFDWCDVGIVEMFCNTGDLIFVDVEINIISGLGFMYKFTVDPLTGLDPCGLEPIEFSGLGEPIQGGELQPFDPDAFKPAIVTFDEYVAHTDILKILDNTTKSIAFSDTTDQLKLRNGDVKSITIPSLSKHKATFELKTNSI